MWILSKRATTSPWRSIRNERFAALSADTLIASEPTCTKMPSVRASSRNVVSAASCSSGTMLAKNRSRPVSMMLVISGVSTYSAPRSLASPISLAAASVLGCGLRPERIWIRPTRKLEGLPFAISRGSPSGRQQRVEPAGPLERAKLVATADVGRSDEDLRRRGFAVGAADHLGAALLTAGHVDLVERDALAAQQLFRPGAIRAIRSGVDHDRDHQIHLQRTIWGCGWCPQPARTPARRRPRRRPG